MHLWFPVFLCLTSSFPTIQLTKAKATTASRSKSELMAVLNAEIDGDNVGASDDAGRFVDAPHELQHDSLMPTSDSKSKHEMETERNVDGAGRMRRSCGGGGSCGGCGGCGSCGGCGCGCSCCSCYQKSCCSTCTTCTTTTTCCKTCCQQCCQSCCGCGNCGGGGCGSDGCGGRGRKKRDIMELLEGRLLRGKRSPETRRRRIVDGMPIKKKVKVLTHIGF
uniref:Uncharacterized protein n=1 Tax=Setaria digitata TaxID=48799 RepID=A0A915PIL2_9BILA